MICGDGRKTNLATKAFIHIHNGGRGLFDNRARSKIVWWGARMSNQQARNTVRVTTLTDAQVLDILHSMVMKFPNSNMSLTSGDTGLGQFNNAIAVKEHFPDVDWTSGRSISTASASLIDGKVSLHFQRHVTSFASGQPVQVASLWECEFFFVRGPSSNPDPREYLSVRRYFDELSEKFILTPGAPNLGMDDAASAIATQIAKLADLQAQITLGAERARQANETKHDEQRAMLDAAHAARIEQLEADFRQREVILNDAADALDRRAQTLDDRDHMHVRRSLRADITKAMRERLAEPPVSKQTSSLRGTINFYSSAGIVILLAIAAFGAWDTHNLVNRADVGAWALGYATLRFIAPLAVATGIYIYLLGWFRKIHSEDVRSERDLERYRLDIDRASWAAETILEAQSETGTLVPDVWIAGATQGLFSGGGVRDDDEAARDALAALLGFSARAQVGTDGAQLEFRKDGLRKMGKL